MHVKEILDLCNFYLLFRVRLETASPEIGIDPPIRTVTAENLLTRISSVPQRQTAQMHDNRPQRPQIQQMGFRQGHLKIWTENCF